jgi:hypothetical protein
MIVQRRVQRADTSEGRVLRGTAGAVEREQQRLDPGRAGVVVLMDSLALALGLFGYVSRRSRRRPAKSKGRAWGLH